jgi:hypothetical protein
MASIGDVANRLLARPVPVLLADTCVLLDIGWPQAARLLTI